MRRQGRALDVVLTQQWTIEERSNLVVSVMRGDQRRWEALSLNEMALHREPLTSMCHFEIAIGRQPLQDAIPHQLHLPPRPRCRLKQQRLIL